MNVHFSPTVCHLHGRQIFDSRGIPTVEVTVTLSDGTQGTASVPSGASTGRYEACELRDKDKDYNGKSVYTAINAIDTILNDAIHGIPAENQYKIDWQMREADGTPNKGRLGANAILAVSLAVARASANARGISLYRYLGGAYARLLPLPFMNIMNGGAHASNNLDIQEFMIVPVGAHRFSEAMKMGTETYHALKKLLSEEKLSTAIGDEGGFAPMLSSDEEALRYLTDAIEKAGYQPGKDIALALDVAASEWYENGEYHLSKRNKIMDKNDLFRYYRKLISDYPIISIEDPFGEEDWESFREFTASNNSLQIVGDDLFVTNASRLRRGIEINAGNAILIKPNQIGTLSETLETIAVATENRFNTMISHRSGETCDDFIADLSVAVNAGEIKTGAPCRGERLAKYNRLLHIEELLGDSAVLGTFH